MSERDEYLRARPWQLRRDIETAIAGRLVDALRDHDGVLVESDWGHGRFTMRLRAEGDRHVRRHLQAVARAVCVPPIRLDDGSVHRVQVGVGWARYDGCEDTADSGEPDLVPEEIRHLAAVAASESLRQRDLVAKAVAAKDPRRRTPSRRLLVSQVVASVLLSTALPWLVMVASLWAGYDVSDLVYVVVVGGLVVTAALIFVEAMHAYTPAPLPGRPPGRPPRASAIIAAYLPNEAETIVETLRHFLMQDYPGELEVILAYNTEPGAPSLQVESDLRVLAATDARLRLLHVPDSSSKAQNVNAAVEVATGEFIGIFDADHHPMPGAFTRAWHWLGSGEGATPVADVVQGHCVIRNTTDTVVARTVAAEFEQIYAVAHPGRTAMHGFGIFGGSNGFWRASALQDVRLRADRLTEDIDSSLRALLRGYRIVTDPGLVSRELAPVTLRALWRQRIRWAQGWFEVSLNLLWPALRSRRLTARQKLGIVSLLVWREISPWLSALPLPLIAFFYWRDGTVDWSTALFVLTGAYTLSAGPVQALTAWRLAVPELRWRGRIFLPYLLVLVFVFSEYKNVVVRVAQLKHLTGERHWSITPREVPSAAVAPSGSSLIPAQRRARTGVPA